MYSCTDHDFDESCLLTFNPSLNIQIIDADSEEDLLYSRKVTLSDFKILSKTTNMDNTLEVFYDHLNQVAYLSDRSISAMVGEENSKYVLIYKDQNSYDFTYFTMANENSKCANDFVVVQTDFEDAPIEKINEDFPFYQLRLSVE